MVLVKWHEDSRLCAPISLCSLTAELKYSIEQNHLLSSSSV